MVFAARLALLALSVVGVRAGKMVEGDACDPSRNRLDQGTYNFLSDCDPQTWCGPDNICIKRGCRRDIYPYGYYGTRYEDLPPLCPEGQFCPDEGSGCLPKSELGGPCQKDRDGESAGLLPIADLTRQTSARPRPTRRSSRPTSTSTDPSASASSATTPT
jgi:hypothetical protein